MKPDEAFEQRLRKVPLKALPEAWRREILDRAHAAEAQATSQGRRAGLRELLTSLFWPHPRAWAALGSAWIVIVFLNLQLRDDSAAVQAHNAAAPAPQIEQARRQKAQLYAELGFLETPDADRPRKIAPRPRTDRASATANV